MSATGTFTQYPSLVETLPPLVRKQRRLEGQIAKVAQATKDETAVRGEIDQLLVAAGLEKSELVTCAGYDVRHNVREGNSSLNADKITEQLAAAGVDRGLVAQVLADSTEIGNPALFATVKPSKGVQVRAPQSAPATMRLLGRTDAAADRKRA